MLFYLLQTSSPHPPLHPLHLPAYSIISYAFSLYLFLTFSHSFLLSYSRIESQDYFYREIVVPRLRNSLRPMLDPEIIKIKKQC